MTNIQYLDMLFEEALNLERLDTEPYIGGVWDATLARSLPSVRGTVLFTTHTWRIFTRTFIGLGIDILHVKVPLN